ncbi:MAG: OprO/OprP family phosphate-selective porin [Dysgonamonadaceae bacterium]|nr:OprO/OprP family phosphate-selective porin [Dysgonamonadaceae bacterium]
MKKFFLICCFLTAFVSSQAQEITAKYKKAFVSEAFQLNGYGQIVADFSQNPALGQARMNANNSIDLARVILFATGKLGEQRQFGYMLMFDAGPNTALQEIYGEWLPCDAVNLRFGQSKTPFTIENPMSASRMETIFPSRSVSAMAGSSGDFNQYAGTGGVKAGRDAGLALYGKAFAKDDFFLLEYSAGLYNGTGLNTKDENNHKDFIGTAYFQPIKGLKIGGSIYAGKLNTDSIGVLPAGNHNRDAFAVGGVFDGKHFYARSEYIANSTGNIDRQGIYASAVWKIIPSKWEILGKCDFYDSDRSISQNEITDYTFGINYYLAYLTKIQLNYIYSDNKLQGVNHSVAVQLQVFF